MREAVIEQFLVREVERLGGVALKVGHSGWPDRCILLPGERIGWAELKAPGKKPRALQTKRLEALRLLGFIAEAPDSIQTVLEFLERVACG